MTTRTDYTEDEWNRLLRGPIVAGLAISIADPGGPIEATKETLASVRVIGDPPEGEPLLAEISAEVRDRSQNRENPMGDFRLEGAAVAGAQVLDELREIAGILDAKASPTEAVAYRAWMMEAANAAAEAAKEGGFLGIGGQQVSEGEAAMIGRIREALGTTPMHEAGVDVVDQADVPPAGMDVG